jgi:hypothetical protein
LLIVCKPLKNHIMKKVTLLFTSLFLFSLISFAQVKEGDIQIVQKYFGVEKMAVVKDYMKLTPKEDSLFWKDYNTYETQRQAIGKKRLDMTNEYMKVINNVSETTATQLVDRANAIDNEFNALIKKYFTKFSKTIGPVKAAQFYQFENYINNIIKLTIQENIPFVGELELKHQKAGSKKK